jgi:hypothetical protein
LAEQAWELKKIADKKQIGLPSDPIRKRWAKKIPGPAEDFLPKLSD